MNSLDVALVVVVAAFLVYGAVKGLTRMVLGSIALVMGVFLGCWYNVAVAALLERWIGNEAVRRLTAFGIVFLATLAAFGVLVWVIVRTLEAAQLRWADRLTGALLGLAVAALLAGAILVPLTAFLPPDSALLGGSRLSPYVLKISSLVKGLVPAELKQRYETARERMATAGKGILPGGGDVPMPPSVPEVLKGIEGLKKEAAPQTQPAPPDPNAKGGKNATAPKPTSG